MQLWLHNLGYMTRISCSGRQLLAEVLNAEVLERLRAEHPDIRYSHGFVFQQLVEGPRAVGEVAENLGVTSQAISKAARELEALGYLERVAGSRRRAGAPPGAERARTRRGGGGPRRRAPASTASWPRRSGAERVEAAARTLMDALIGARRDVCGARSPGTAIETLTMGRGP